MSSFILSSDPQEAALGAAVLWNLSACEDLKENILDDSNAIPHIIDGVILPKAQYQQVNDHSNARQQ